MSTGPGGSGMVAAIEVAGGEIESLAPSAESPAQVFTADGAIILGASHALVLRNDGPRGTLEPRAFAKWLSEDGFAVESIPPNRTLDGGNTLRLHNGSFACGLKPQSDGSGEQYFKKLLELTGGGSFHTLRLIDRRYLHLDMAMGASEMPGTWCLNPRWKGAFPRWKGFRSSKKRSLGLAMRMLNSLLATALPLVRRF